MGWLDRIRSIGGSVWPGSPPDAPNPNGPGEGPVVQTNSTGPAGPDTRAVQTTQKKGWFSAIGSVFGLWGRLRLWAKIVLPLLFLAFFLLPLISMFWSTIDDRMDVGVAERSLKPGQSRAIAIVSRLIRREVEENAWVANDFLPWPSAWLDDMPNYQLGLMSALGGFSDALRKRLGSSGGTTDGGLTSAAAGLGADGTRWTNPNPEAQYVGAADQFDAFNAKLATNAATFDRRRGALKDTLFEMADLMTKDAEALELYVRTNAGFLGFIDWGCDKPFYRTKGHTYGTRAVLIGLGTDFRDAIAQAGLGTKWQDMMASFDAAVGVQPWYVMNGSPDSSLIPNHLAGLGFHTLQARSKLLDIARAL